MFVKVLIDMEQIRKIILMIFQKAIKYNTYFLNVYLDSRSVFRSQAFSIKCHAGQYQAKVFHTEMNIIITVF